MNDSAEPQEAKAPIVLCVACCSELRAGASICSTCKTYQSRWRGGVSYAASVAGFLALLGSALAFIYSVAAEPMKTMLFGDRVYISYLNYPGTLVLVNSGYQDVFVTNLNFYWSDGNANEEIQIDKPIPKRGFVSVNLDYIDRRSAAGPRILPREKANENNYVWISSHDDKNISDLVLESAPGLGRKCVIYRFMTKDAPHIQRMNAFWKDSGRHLSVVGIQAEVNWLSLDSGKARSASVSNIVMGFQYDPEAGCKESDWFK
ncbi:hypothetical protein [Pseudomonas nitroreducens]|uniref:hypothetical protein n=1 Tax=Pseudomonas nitroreducens TaxID=46680 RepID=UPI0026592183|nr:hypothetical protein [Pseudomonas nitroreducens]MCP1651557.1 hypothetical protein [Pseudomonas nitroreducens]MCP1684577.1 hypothetical protein [Pseudomonas nitroreducens]